MSDFHELLKEQVIKRYNSLRETLPDAPIDIIHRMVEDRFRAEIQMIMEKHDEATDIRSGTVHRR